MSRIYFEKTQDAESPIQSYDQEVQNNVLDVRELDPEILDHSETTRRLVELGLEHINQVTEKYGTTEHPKWASGSYEHDVIMSYHNGGQSGHTSVGSTGVGVPRNVLIIAKAVNAAARSEVYDPLARAVAFNAAAAHDVIQLCGRSLLDEGKTDQSRGDERLSAEYARQAYLQSGGEVEIAQRIYDGVMATAFNPNTGTQNVARRDDYHNEVDAIQCALGQELVAAADLLSPTTPRGPLGAFEYCVELLSTRQNNQLTQAQLSERGLAVADIPTMHTMLAFIDSDAVLRDALNKMMTGQARFFKEFISYSDSTIKMVCGKGIDELFPGRLLNGDIIQGLSEDLRAGKSAQEVWESARRINDEAS